MENNTRLEQLNSDSEKNDLINSTQILGRALGLILENLEGIVIDTLGEINFEDGTKKVLVYKYENEILITRCTEDIPDGTTIKLSPNTESEKN